MIVAIHQPQYLPWLGYFDKMLKADVSERRVAFVACSRAMSLLYLSHSLTYMGQPAKKSIFFDEILGVKEPETLS